MSSTDFLSLKWNNHSTTLLSIISDLQHKVSTFSCKEFVYSSTPFALLLVGIWRVEVVICRISLRINWNSRMAALLLFYPFIALRIYKDILVHYLCYLLSLDDYVYSLV